MKFRTVIAEDEPHSLERLKDLLKAFEKIQIVGEAVDGFDAIEKIESLKPDLVFLDIQMPGATGFEVLEKINQKPTIIFVTAYDSYAIKAFEAKALDYILKPTSKERLAQTVNRVLELRKHSTPGWAPGLIEDLKHAVMGKSYLKRFAVKTGDEILIIAESDVFYFNADKKYNFLHTKSKRFFFEMTLKELEDSLDPEIFCRIHKSAIVSLDKIKKLKKWFHSELIVQLNDSEGTISRWGAVTRQG